MNKYPGEMRGAVPRGVNAADARLRQVTDVVLRWLTPDGIDAGAAMVEICGLVDPAPVSGVDVPVSDKPLFAVGVARRKWESLQDEGYRMQRIEFAMSKDGKEKRGSIDPWGKVMWTDGVPAPRKCTYPNCTCKVNWDTWEGCEVGAKEPPTDGVTSDGETGMAWWNGLTDEDRSYWMKVSLGTSPAEAWAYFKRCGAAGVAEGLKR